MSPTPIFTCSKCVLVCVYTRVYVYKKPEKLWSASAISLPLRHKATRHSPKCVTIHAHSHTKKAFLDSVSSFNSSPSSSPFYSPSVILLLRIKLLLIFSFFVFSLFFLFSFFFSFSFFFLQSVLPLLLLLLLLPTHARLFRSPYLLY